jgi:hypothetical protein
MHTLSSGRVLFGAFELDLSTGELRSIEAPDPNNKVLLRRASRNGESTALSRNDRRRVILT